MGKNGSVLPKGGERRAGGPLPRLLEAGVAIPEAGQPRAWDRHRDLPSGGPDGERESNKGGSGSEVTCHPLETSFTP